MPGYMKKLSKLAGGAIKAYADKDGSGKVGQAAQDDFGKIMDKFKPKKPAAKSGGGSNGKYDDIG